MRNKVIFSFLWQHIKPYKWYYIVMLMAPVVSAFYPFAHNYAIKLFIDIMDVDHFLTISEVWFPITLFLAANVVLDVVWRISSIAEWLSEPYVRRSILLHSYNYVQHHSYKYFQHNFTGAISSKIKGILDGYDKFWAEMHHGLLSKIFKVFVNLAALVFINLKLGLFICSWCTLYVPVMYKLSKKLNYLAFAETEVRHSMMGNIADRITNIITLFAFASRRTEYKKLDKQIKSQFIPKQLKLYKYNFKVDIIAGLLFWLMMAFLLFYMLYLKNHGHISIGDFAFVFGISLVVSEDIWSVTQSLQDFSRAMGDFKSALAIVCIPQENLDLPHAKKLQISSSNIEFKDIKFGYDKKSLVFDNLNLTIKSGEKIGLVGQSGSGKSTLVNLLLRYFDYKTGEILISGSEIKSVTQDSLRANIAIIPQDTILFHRTLMENIRYGKNTATDDEVIEASKKAHIHEYIVSLPEGYNTYVGERGIKLSGGQRQRVAIARAILKDVPILVLDEATSALDSNTEKLIQDSLELLIKDQTKTIIAIAHRLSTLKNMDRILVLEKGKIVQQGTHNKLIKQKDGLYSKLWQQQIIEQQK